MKFFRFASIVIAVLGIGAAGYAYVRFLNTPIACPGCNVILISIDTLRADALPCFGYGKDTAPNLCKFADRSFRFTRAYSQSPYTLDSHTTMLTSLYASVHGMTQVYASTLPKDIRTLPEILRDGGYRTVYAANTRNPYLPLEKGIGRGFETVTYANSPPEWVSALRDANVSGKKFFAFLHTSGAHGPYFASPGTIAEFLSRPPERYASRDEVCMSAFHILKRSGRIPASVQTRGCDDFYRQIREEGVVKDDVEGEFRSLVTHIYYEMVGRDPEILRAMYDAEIREFDTMFAEFLDYLTENRLLENTMIVVTADHGEEFMEHGEFEHAHALYEESIRVPLLVYVPGASGRTSRRVVGNIDILPTVLAVLGMPPYQPAQGINVFGKERREYIVSELFANRKRAVITDRWKLIANTSESVPFEVYDLREDPRETRNVAVGKPDVSARLRVLLDGYMAGIRGSIRTTEPAPYPTWIDEEKRRKLIETGYF